MSRALGVGILVGSLLISGCSSSHVVAIFNTPVPSALPPMNNVHTQQFGTTAWLDFDPVDGALDYRVYVLPHDGESITGTDGVTTIHNATYRCAGDREAPVVTHENDPEALVKAISAGPDSAYPFARTEATATLGYVYSTDGPDRVPVYALGDPAFGSDGSGADNVDCADNPLRFQASRVKVYTTSAVERTALVAQHWRDDGIQFWVPSAASASTQMLHRVVRPIAPNIQGSNFVVPDGPEHDALSTDTRFLPSTPMFPVFTTQITGTQPLMRVYYRFAWCARNHDELAAGNARFQQIMEQGHFPLSHLTWSGITAPTTLVIEALDQGCPYQGYLGLTHHDAWTDSEGVTREAILTLGDLRASSMTGEVFVNGQHEPTNRPRAIARSIITVQPQSLATMDWRLDYQTLSALQEVPIDRWQTHHFVSNDLDLMFIEVANDASAFGTMLGQFWLVWGDVAAGTPARVRLSPTRMAEISSTDFVHVTMQTDLVTTGRRFPQIILSTAVPPIQTGSDDAMAQGTSVLFQTWGDWPNQLQVQVCQHQPWAPDLQCPVHRLEVVSVPNGQAGSTSMLPPAPEVSELGGVDRSAQWDIFASTTRMYVLINGQPMGCADFTATPMPAGPVSVTFGDVLFDSSLDVVEPVYAFHHQHLRESARRHWDNLGFSSHVALPSWDDAGMPCGSDFMAQ